MRIMETASANPGDLGLRIDSDREREFLSRFFPGMGMEKHTKWWDGYPHETSLLYDSLYNPYDDYKQWMIDVGWDEARKALDIIIKASKWTWPTGKYERLEDRWGIEVIVRGSRESPWNGREEFKFTSDARKVGTRNLTARALRKLLY